MWTMSTNLIRRFLNTLCAEYGSLMIYFEPWMILVFIVDGCRRVRALTSIHYSLQWNIYMFQFIRWSVILVFIGNDCILCLWFIRHWWSCSHRTRYQSSRIVFLSYQHRELFKVHPFPHNHHLIPLISYSLSDVLWFHAQWCHFLSMILL